MKLTVGCTVRVIEIIVEALAKKVIITKRYTIPFLRMKFIAGIYITEIQHCSRIRELWIELWIHWRIRYLFHAHVSMWYIPPYKVKDLTDQVAAAKGLISGHIAFEMKHSAEVIPAISSMVLHSLFSELIIGPSSPKCTRHPPNSHRRKVHPHYRKRGPPISVLTWD